jgi:putative peptidoglycan lipid II flippase
VRIIVAAFYSLQDTRTPAVSAAVAVGANILLSLLLMRSLGAAGLAFATALAAMVNGSILVAVLNRRLGGIEWEAVGRSSLRVAVACIPMAATCWWAASAPVWTHPDDWIAKSVVLFTAIGVSVGSYAGVHAMLRSDELDVMWGMVRRKLGRIAGSKDVQ